MIHKLISRFWIRLDKGRQFNWCKDSKGLLWVQAEACSINEQMQKQVNQSILVFFRCIVNVHCLVNIKALKEKKRKNSNIMAYSFASGSSVWFSILRYRDHHSGCIRLHRGAALRQQLDNSSLEQLTCISVDGPLVPSGLQKSYL